MKGQPKSYSDEFKRQVLEDYFRSGKTKAACCRQWGIPWTTFKKWVDACINEKKKCIFAAKIKRYGCKGSSD